MDTPRRTLLKFTALGLGLGAVAVAAPALHAQAAWPEQPIRMVIPFPPGGPTDLVSRVLGEALSAQVGQSVIADNKPGANANIGAEIVARAPADGYTLLYNTSSLALSRVLYSKLKYDALTDFAPVALTAVVPLVLVVHPSLPVKNVAEFIDYAKKNAGKLSYGSASNGNVTHLAAFQFLHVNSLDATHIPYKGSAPALVDLVGGQVQFMTDTINSALPYIRDGRLRALGVLSAKRVASLPDVPTIAETVPGYELTNWFGLVAPAATPKDLLAKISADVSKALQDQGLRDKITALSAAVVGDTPEQFGATMRADSEKWARVIREAGIKAE